MKLTDFIENPNNPSKFNAKQIDCLHKKIERVQDGLKAIRIAYVTDEVPGKKLVISGNKRLKVLKDIFGEDGECPDEYFQDMTSMDKAARHEFIVTANVSDGEWDIEKLVNQYSIQLLSSYGMDDMLSQLPSDAYNQISSLWEVDDQEKLEKDKTTNTKEDIAAITKCRCSFYIGQSQHTTMLKQ